MGDRDRRRLPHADRSHAAGRSRYYKGRYIYRPGDGTFGRLRACGVLAFKVDARPRQSLPGDGRFTQMTTGSRRRGVSRSTSGRRGRRPGGVRPQIPARRARSREYRSYGSPIDANKCPYRRARKVL